MKIIDILTSPWSILPEKLAEIKEIYSTHLRGDKIDFEAIKPKLKAEEPEEPYQIVNDIAIIPIQGVIAKRMNMFLNISGGTSSELVGRDFSLALDDDAVKGILLDIDSPGGTVDGTMELVETIYQGRDKKPIIAFSDGLMTSAAYWIGSAAHEIYISSGSVQTGSIGILASHVDHSEYEKKQGIKTTEIFAGKYKRIASQYEPLSKEGKRSIQDEVDYLYSLFVDGVAKNRGIKSEKIAKTEAKIFIGKQAIRAGLVDGVDTKPNIINRLVSGVEAQTQKKQIRRIKNMDLKEMKSEYPDLYASIVKEAESAGYEKGLAEGEAKGTEAGKIMERKRIQAVAEVALPGHEELVETMMFDGTPAADAAVKVLAAEKAQREAAEKALRDSAIKPVDNLNMEDAETNTGKPFEQLVKAIMDTEGVSKGEAIKAVVRAHPKAHEEYINRINEKGGK